MPRRDTSRTPSPEREPSPVMSKNEIAKQLIWEQLDNLEEINNEIAPLVNHLIKLNPIRVTPPKDRKLRFSKNPAYEIAM